ncbi:hypothetical protein AVEN_209953-1 [Araneus ventricosus]|uniref:Uncharacterized protein n=1 Tax=Araneus ventricosus TaxID=182803 RepID=A0A4Y2DB96_ARAVE|nr:hypothetical protein AVEN_209953-1 [Araneus ventricosus]
MLTNLHVLDLPESEKHNFRIMSVCEHDNSKTIRATGMKFGLGKTPELRHPRAPFLRVKIQLEVISSKLIFPPLPLNLKHLSTYAGYLLLDTSRHLQSLPLSFILAAVLLTKPAGVFSPKLSRILPQKGAVSPSHAWLKKFEPTVIQNPMTIRSFFIIVIEKYLGKEFKEMRTDQNASIAHC